MIKFFRNIRKKLLAESKITNYLKYAFGEIILVVIGILIALQVNNWNEARKDNKVRKEFTVSLINNFEKDSLFLNKLIVELEIGMSRSHFSFYNWPKKITQYFSQIQRS